MVRYIWVALAILLSASPATATHIDGWEPQPFDQWVKIDFSGTLEDGGDFFEEGSSTFTGSFAFDPTAPLDESSWSDLYPEIAWYFSVGNWTYQMPNVQLFQLHDGSVSILGEIGAHFWMSAILNWDDTTASGAIELWDADAAWRPAAGTVTQRLTGSISVAEPSTLLLAALGSLTALRRRRSRNAAAANRDSPNS